MADVRRFVSDVSIEINDSMMAIDTTKMMSCFNAKCDRTSMDTNPSVVWYAIRMAIPSNESLDVVGSFVRWCNRNTRFRLYCRYQETDESKVEMTCLQEDNKTFVKTLGCIYVHNGFDTLFVHPGTYTMWTKSVDNESIGVSCRVCSSIDTKYELCFRNMKADAIVSKHSNRKS